MEDIAGIVIVWGGTTVVAALFLLWTYTPSGKKWLKNL